NREEQEQAAKATKNVPKTAGKEKMKKKKRDDKAQIAGRIVDANGSEENVTSSMISTRGSFTDAENIEIAGEEGWETVAKKKRKGVKGKEKQEPPEATEAAVGTMEKRRGGQQNLRWGRHTSPAEIEQ